MTAILQLELKLKSCAANWTVQNWINDVERIFYKNQKKKLYFYFVMKIKMTKIRFLLCE